MLPPDVEVRRADSADLIAFYGKLPAVSCKAWVARWKGETVCCAGVAYEDIGPVAFSDMKPGIKAPPIKIWRTAKYLLEEMRASGLPLIVELNRRKHNSEEFLKSLGFMVMRTEGNCILLGFER